MKRINFLFYVLIIFVLNYPAKVFGASIPSDDVQALYGVAPFYYADPWYIVAGRWLLFPVLPLILLILIIIFIAKKVRKRK